MQATYLYIAGRGSQMLAPASGVDLVRLQDLQSGLAGCAPLAHVHVSSQITDFSTAVVAVLAANGVPLSGVVNLNLTPQGGLLNDALGLRVNSGVVSFVGHHHLTADLTDFPAALAAQLGTTLVSTATLVWQAAGNELSGVVPLVSGGGVLSTGDGLMLDSGVVNQWIRAQLPTVTPLTLGPSSTLALTLAGQELAGEVILVPAGGLLASPSGVQCDFGTGHNQVMRGDALTGLSVGVTTALNSPTLQLVINGNVLSGVVPLDGAPATGYGMLSAGVNGLRVVLGTSANTAAAGNHTHSEATPTSDGFMSASQASQLATLWAETPPSGVTVYSTATLALSQAGQNLSGVVVLSPMAGSGRALLAADATGIYLPLSQISIEGTLVVNGVSQTAPVNPSGVAAWFAAAVNGTNYMIPLYQ